MPGASAERKNETRLPAVLLDIIAMASSAKPGAYPSTASRMAAR
jgi:hypothetical protein